MNEPTSNLKLRKRQKSAAEVKKFKGPKHKPGRPTAVLKIHQDSKEHRYAIYFCARPEITEFSGATEPVTVSAEQNH